MSEISGQSDDINYQYGGLYVLHTEFLMKPSLTIYIVTFGSFQSIRTKPAKQPPDSTYSSRAMLVMAGMTSLKALEDLSATSAQ